MKKFTSILLAAALSAMAISVEAAVLSVEAEFAKEVPPWVVSTDSALAFSVAPVPAAVTVEFNLVSQPVYFVVVPDFLPTNLIGLEVAEKETQSYTITYHAEVIGVENIDRVGGGDGWLFGKTTSV